MEEFLKNWPLFFWDKFQGQFGRYMIAVLATVAIVWLLKKTPWRTRQIQNRKASKQDILREFLSSIRSSAIFVVVPIIIMWGADLGIFQRVRGSQGLVNDVTMFVAILFFHDAYFYWTHRAMHHRKLYKLFHRHHHRSVTPTAFAAYSFAIPEAFVNAMFIPIWQLFVPTSLTVLIPFVFIQVIRNTTQHAGLELHPSWWLKNPVSRFVSTTTHHDMHHSGGFQYNFGFYFTFWDRLMGTEHPDYHRTFNKVVGNIHKNSVQETDSSCRIGLS